MMASRGLWGREYFISILTAHYLVVPFQEKVLGSFRKYAGRFFCSSKFRAESTGLFVDVLNHLYGNFCALPSCLCGIASYAAGDRFPFMTWVILQSNLQNQSYHVRRQGPTQWPWAVPHADMPWPQMESSPFVHAFDHRILTIRQDTTMYQFWSALLSWLWNTGYLAWL